MKQATDMIEALTYKLRMLGIPIDSKARVLCDNDAVVKTSSNPDARLPKKYNSIAFHRIRECVVFKMILIYHEKGDSNLADILTKVLPVKCRVCLLQGIMNETIEHMFVEVATSIVYPVNSPRGMCKY